MEAALPLIEIKLSIMKKHHFIRFVALLLVCCAMLGCGKENNPSGGNSSGNGSIYGCITDFATGDPVRNANVQLRPSGETTLTGYDGMYEFLDIADGNYSITVSKAEYTDLIDDYVIEVKNGKRMRRDVQIEKLPVALRVIDANGNDISSLDFGAEQDVTSRTFSIFNDSPQRLTWWVEENCNWIVEVKSMLTNNQSGELESGRQEPIKVTINRSLLGTGLKTYILNINSSNGSKELLITAGEEVGMPSVTTQQISNVTSSSVTFNGTIVNPGLPSYTERGFVYSTRVQPTLENNMGKITSAVNGQASFSATVYGLNSNVTYYVRAYAINALAPAYGNDVTFNTNGVPASLTTSAVTNISTNSATLNGTIDVAGSPNYTEKGFCYRKNGEPSISDNKKIVSGSGTGAYSANISGLEYQTTYYVKAYAIQNGQPVYGNTVNFSTSWTAVQVNTSAVTSIEANGATFNGVIRNAGTPAYTERGFCYDDWSSTPTISNHKIVANGVGITGNFNKSVTGLNGGTRYYVRAYAIQNGEVVYGEETVNFTTVQLPVVYTNEVTDLTASEWPVTWSVTFNGYVASAGSPTYSERGFCYNTYSDPTYLNNKVVVSGNGTGNYSKTVTGLSDSKTYYVRAYVKTSSGQYIYGQNVSFDTYSWKKEGNE